MFEQLRQLLESASTVLITTHISPDPDALTSQLLMGRTLAANYPDKKVVMSIEELTGGLKFLPGYDKIEKSDLNEALQKHKPDLIVIVDAMNWQRCTRGDALKVAETVGGLGSKVVIIDHHEPETKIDSDVYINQGSPAAIQDVFEICFHKLGLKKPADYAQTALLGLYSDTGGFTYENPRLADTFKMTEELVGDGASIEKIKNLLNQYTEPMVWALGELAKNTSHHGDYSFSYISDEFTDKWLSEKLNFDELHVTVGFFANTIIRNIDGRKWGFVIYKDIRGGENMYGVSFRAVTGAKDVTKFAAKLGGGGHKPAAGAKFEAKNVQEALKLVQSTISEV